MASGAISFLIPGRICARRASSGNVWPRPSSLIQASWGGPQDGQRGLVGSLLWEGEFRVPGWEVLLGLECLLVEVLLKE